MTLNMSKYDWVMGPKDAEIPTCRVRFWTPDGRSIHWDIPPHEAERAETIEALRSQAEMALMEESR